MYLYYYIGDIIMQQNRISKMCVELYVVSNK